MRWASHRLGLQRQTATSAPDIKPLPANNVPVSAATVKSSPARFNGEVWTLERPAPILSGLEVNRLRASKTCFKNG